MKTNKLLKVKKIANEKYEEIIAKIIEAKKEAEGYMQGMHVSVLIDKDGEIYYTGAMSQNSMTQGQFDGSALTIANLECWRVGWDGYDYNFDEDVKNIDEYEELQKEYEADEEHYSFFNFVSKEHPEIIEKLDDEYKEYLIDEWFPEMAAEKLDEFLRELEEQIR